jgi:uncharacterized phiE125 gp8 family phage protein
VLAVIIEKTGSITEVVTIATARSHLNLTASGSPATHPDDDYIEDILIPSAREYVEEYLGSAVALQSVVLTMTGWADIKLPFATFATITNIKYDDANGDETTMSTDDYWYSKENELIFRTLPILYNAPDNVRVTYQTGYDTSSPANKTIPHTIIKAMLLHIADGYENREASTQFTNEHIKLGIESLLTPHRELGI